MGNKDLDSRQDITITLESPRQDVIIKFLEELDAYLSSLYPPEDNYLLGIDELDQPHIRFFVARRHGEALGCGALRIDSEGWGEVKRMFVLPEARGLHIGRYILRRIIEVAYLQGLTCLRLETGNKQDAARALYRSTGFVECDPFGEYTSNPTSIFMEMTL